VAPQRSRHRFRIRRLPWLRAGSFDGRGGARERCTAGVPGTHRVVDRPRGAAAQPGALR
jgi:hypothetical protein